MELQLIQTGKYSKRINNGYISIFINNCWILEHKFNVEQFIGRKLVDFEVIHHIDENKQNNRISNLFLFKSQKEHQKFHNKVSHFGWTNNRCKEVANRWDKYFEDGNER